MLHAMIMAGGGGTRFWPRSRQRRPKQFLNISGERSLLQLALDRLEALALPPQRWWVITAEAYRGQTAEQLPSLPPSHIVGEPCGRDTAACIGGRFLASCNARHPAKSGGNTPGEKHASGSDAIQGRLPR